MADEPPWGPEQEEGLRQVWVTEPPKLVGPVLIADYDATWPAQYEVQAGRVRLALGDRVLCLEHIGSTSVPGLPAKPVIDMLLVVADAADDQAYVPDLEAAGYPLAISESGPDPHRVLKGTEPSVNLHVLSPDSPEIARYLGFRDHLRSSQADRELYEQAKRRLVGRSWTYMQQYADAKSEVVEAILKRAMPG